ncbi:MAG: nucleotidyltransferase domain-containing protein [Candidatus Caldarchaeum sp.]
MKKRLEKYVDWLKQRYQPSLVIVFGSLVRDSWTLESDIDIVVVSERLSPDVGENFTVLKQPGIDPLGFTPEMFIKEIEKPNLLIFDALQYGVVLCADAVFLEKVRSLFEDVKKRYGLKWTGETWT